MDLKTDLDCLVECLRYCQDDEGKARDTSLTIASLCAGSAEAQNLFRSCGGLSQMVNLLSTAQDDAFKEAVLYTLGCAVERNVFSQSRLCTKAMFQFLYCQLTNERLSVQRTTTFLIMCLVTNNGRGQTLVRETKCLDAMLQLFRNFPGLHLPYSPDTGDCDERNNKLSLELWKDVTGTLCGCVNNPQNDENQLVCASSVPAALYIMSHSNNSHVTQLLCSYISLLAANNTVNQDRLHMLGGLDVIVAKLKTIVDDIVRQPDKGTILSASNLISMLSSVISDNENNLKALSSLNIVPLLLKLLALDIITQDIKLKVIITLGCFVAANDVSKKQVQECDGLKLLLSFMMANQDGECAKAATLVLHSCINADFGATEEEKGSNVRSKKEQGSPQHQCPQNNQTNDLQAKIDTLQKELQEERSLRKSLEDDKEILQRSLEGSIVSVSKEKEEEFKVPLTPKTNGQSTVPNVDDHQTRCEVNLNTSRQSSRNLEVLQDRMTALEQKLLNLAADRPVTDVNNNNDRSDMDNSASSSETSDSESIDDFHRSVSEVEFEVTKPSNENSAIRTNKRLCKKKAVISPTNENREDFQLQTSKEKSKSEETPKFKMPPPVKRYRPLQLVHGNTPVKRVKSISPRIKPVSTRTRSHKEREELLPPSKIHKVVVEECAKLQQSCDPSLRNTSNRMLKTRGEVTPPTKVQKIDLKGHTVLQESWNSTPRNASQMTRNRRLKVVGSKVYRTLTYTSEGDESALTGQKSKTKQLNEGNTSDADSESSDYSETSSITDSVFTSLSVHLSCPIRPLKPSQQLIKSSPFQPSKRNRKVATKLVVPTVPKHGISRKGQRNKDCSEKYRKDSISASSDVFDFKDDVVNKVNYRIESAKSMKGITPKEHAPMHTDHITQQTLPEDAMAKLRATPKIMLQKTSLMGKNMKMYTFDEKHQDKHTNMNTSDGNPQSKHTQTMSSHSQSRFEAHTQKLEERSAGQKGSGRIFTVKESGSKRKSYSVHFVRGKIQCSRLYKGSAGRTNGIQQTDSPSCLTCLGCVPPRHHPLLDSHNLLHTLMTSKHDLCQKHATLMHAIKRYITNKRSLISLHPVAYRNSIEA